MDYIINTLIPIFMLIATGYFLKRIKFPSTDFWPMADKLTYYVLMPALLVYKLSNAKIDLSHTINLVGTTLLSITVVFLTLIIINVFFKFEKRAFTSIMQGGIRFNSYVFLAFVASVYGDKGLVLAAIVLAFVIPYLNILCISTFALYVRHKDFSLKAFLMTIIKNPLIGACAIGGLINYSNIPLPAVIFKSFGLLSHAALPMGLLSVGVGLELKYLHEAKKELVVATIAKLFYFPSIIYAMGALLGLSGIPLSVAIIFGAMPTAVSGYILARELGGDVTLMASIITFQTLVCMASLFLIVPFI
ncbi:AEC family transporter [Sulfurospirillum sp. 1612]|uniref:AEC family transporter n=1 Tax=Sulfurospirillum sp. 1612 TaxID=3094835 RepID=UPI002F946376